MVMATLPVWVLSKPVLGSLNLDDGCTELISNWFLFKSLHIRKLKKQSFLLLTNSYIPNWGLQKNADGHISSLGDLPREPPYQR